MFAQNIDCGYTLELPRRGGSKEYPQSMFWNKNRYTPAYPSFTVKVGFNGVYISQTCFPDAPKFYINYVIVNTLNFGEICFKGNIQKFFLIFFIFCLLIPFVLWTCMS